MEAYDMNVLLYCLITTPDVDKEGMDEYYFYGWSGLNGTLNPYLIQEMVDQAQNVENYGVSDMSGSSAALQTQLIYLSTSLMNKSPVLTRLDISYNSPLSSE